MQRGRFLILIGILLAVMAVGLLLVMDRGDGEEPGEIVETEELELIPTATPAPTSVPTNRVLVAQQLIPRGTLLITDTVPLNERIDLVEWPSSWVTLDALTSFDQVVGRIARSDIPRGTVLIADMLTDQAGDLAGTGSDAALLIPPERVAVAIPVDHISSVGWSLRRGDRVDVLVSFLMIDLDEEFQTELPNQASSLVSIEAGTVVQEGGALLQGTYGRIEQDPFGQPINVIPSEPNQRPRLVSQITVRDAEVLNVGPWGELFRAVGETTVTFSPVATAEAEAPAETSPAEGEEETQEDLVLQQVEILLEEGQRLSEDEVLREYLNASTSQPLLLIVSPQDALVLRWAAQEGAAMDVVLRSYADADQPLPSTEPVTLQYMVDRFNIGLPPGLAYGSEPAVRQLERTFLKLPEKLWNPWSAQTTETEESPPR
jgi:Flp pilus assembly protein CpaB